MIPGTAHRGRRRRRAVARRRRLGQPAAVAAAVSRLGRHGADDRRHAPEQPVRATAHYSGVYWNDGSFQEFSYVTGADSAEMGQGGMRVNMVPKDGGNAFHGVAYGNYTPCSRGPRTTAVRRGVGLAVRRNEPHRRHHVQHETNNFLTNVSQLTQELRLQHRRRRADHARQGRGSTRTFRYLGVNKTVGRQLLRPRSQVPQFTSRRRHQPAGHRRRPHPQHRGPRDGSSLRRRTRCRITTTSRTRSAVTGASPAHQSRA